MSEATEFLVFCSALRETPERLRNLAGAAMGERIRAVLEEMVAAEAVAIARLEALLAGEVELPGEVELSGTDDPLHRFLDLRRRLLELLDRVDGATLHRVGRLPSGRPLDPWRLAGNLVDHDVRCLAGFHR